MSNEAIAAADDPLAADYPSPEIVECPYPYYSQLRERAPVHQLPNGDFVVSSWELLRYVASKPELFSNVIGPETPGFAESVWASSEEPETGELTRWPLPFTDPPEQKRKRSLLLPLVDPARLKTFEPMIREVANELIDDFIGNGRAEFVADFAAHLPPRVMLRIFGLPIEDEPMLRGWMSVAQGQGFRHASDEDKAIHLAASEEARAYFRKLVLDRHENPTGDFVSALIQDKLELDGELDLYYLVPEVTTLYQASYHNTIYMLANAMVLLLENPEQLAKVRADRSLVRPMIEESLRLESPVQWLQRLVTEDTELGGVRLPKGAILLTLWGAGNRDEAVFDNPDAFEVGREGVVAKQLAFGFGIHKCLGARLARLEGQLAFEELIDRLGEIRLVPGADDGTHITSVNHRAVNAVHIEFDRTS